MSLRLYHNNMSTCAQKVRLALREKHLPHAETHVDLRAGEQNHPDYRRLNPNGVVPTLVDGEHVIIESSVICEYLDDAHPQPSLRPGPAVERARMRWWTIQPDAGLHQAVGLTSVSIAFRHQMMAGGPVRTEQLITARPEAAMRERLRGLIERGLEAPGVDAAIRRYHRFVQQILQQLERAPWLAGDSFSQADIMALPYVVRLEHLGFQFWWRDAAGGERLDAWLQRCRARPSYAAIADYLDAGYLELMERTGAQARQQVMKLLQAG